jgi:pSer/pThr/pTyr-binding forkhead associated (FHA) protein
MSDAPPRLVWERGDGTRQEFPLVSGIMVVGRDEEADIRVDEPLVSRSHARIERRGTSFVVIDLGSTNLTRVNGEVVAERELRHGDELRFARARCVFLADEPAPDPVANGV